MSIRLDHTMVSARNSKASAKLLAEILDVPWSETGVGPFCPVYVNDELTLDFDQVKGTFPVQHSCFRVNDAEFNGIIASGPRGKFGNPQPFHKPHRQGTRA